MGALSYFMFLCIKCISLMPSISFRWKVLNVKKDRKKRADFLSLLSPRLLDVIIFLSLYIALFVLKAFLVTLISDPH